MAMPRSRSKSQVGGRINPRGDQTLYYYASILHFLVNPKSYQSSGKIKPMTYYFVETSNGNQFPSDARYKTLYRSGKTRSITKTLALVSRNSNKKHTLTRTRFLKDGPMNSGDKKDFLKAVANNIWGFLKQKEGDLDRESERQRKHSLGQKGFEISDKQSFGYSVSANYARKAIELMTTYILLEAGFRLEELYYGENSIGHQSDYSLYMKNLLIKVTGSISAAERTSLVKILKKTPTDRVLQVLKSRYPDLVTKATPVHSKERKSRRKNPTALHLYDELETIRYFGNRSSHGGTPDNWEPKLSDAEMEEVADSLEYVIFVFLLFFLNLGNFETSILD